MISATKRDGKENTEERKAGVEMRKSIDEMLVILNDGIMGCWIKQVRE